MPCGSNPAGGRDAKSGKTDHIPCTHLEDGQSCDNCVRRKISGCELGIPPGLNRRLVENNAFAIGEGSPSGMSPFFFALSSLR